MVQKEIDEMRKNIKEDQRRAEEIDGRRENNSSVCYQKKTQMIEHAIEKKDKR